MEFKQSKMENTQNSIGVISQLQNSCQGSLKLQSSKLRE